MIEGAIAVLFRKLSYDSVMTALNLIIHHKVIRVVGSDRNEIFLCCEALHNLIFPFKAVVGTKLACLVYHPYVSLRAYKHGEYPFASLMGFDRSLKGRILVPKQSFVIDIDHDWIGFLKGVDSEADYERKLSFDPNSKYFPRRLPLSDVADKVDSIKGEVENQGRTEMNHHEELRVRYLFFEYFCQLLRHLKQGIKPGAYEKVSSNKANDM